MISTAIMWLHLLAAMAWIGGMLFVVLVLSSARQGVPVVQADGFLNPVYLRFRAVRWASLIILLLTGLYNLLQEGGSARLESAWGGVLMLKMFLFFVGMGLSALYDFILVPALPRRSSKTYRGFVRACSNAILVLSLLIVLIAVTLTGA